MGQVLLVLRLASRNVRRRPAEAGLLVLVIAVASATLTLGLALHGTTDDPYDRTREATAGPDVVASSRPIPVGEPADAGSGWLQAPGIAADPAALETLAADPAVVDYSGPYPMIETDLEVGGEKAGTWVQGRDSGPAALDQPELIEGSWVEGGAVVVEASFADALGVGTGDQISLADESYRVAGVAVTAASRPYPDVCYCPYFTDIPDDDELSVQRPGARGQHLDEQSPEADVVTIDLPPPPTGEPGLIWLTEADTRALVPAEEALSYVMNLKLADPDQARTFVEERLSAVTGAPFLDSWQSIRAGHGKATRNEALTLRIGASLLTLIAIASIAVLVGGRMADQTRRVGLLKAVGGTPRLVAAVLLTEYMALALLAAAAGLAAGWFAAPLLANPGAGLLGSAGAATLTPSTVGQVMAVALGVAVVATFVPALRAARTSTVSALADIARPPRRTSWLIAVSARLPVSLLLGLRVAGRRPRRVVLNMLSIAISVTGIVTALAAYATVRADAELAADPQTDRQIRLLLGIMVLLGALAAVNTIFVTWSTALDARHASALARALGATPNQVGTGLSASQVLPALVGAVLGIAGGFTLFSILVNDEAPSPPLWQLFAVVTMTGLIVSALTAVPARLGARRSTAEILQSELA